MTKSAIAAVAILKLLYDFKMHLFNGHEHQLCNALTGLNLVCPLTSIPARDKYLPLVIGVDQTSQVTKHQPMLVSQSRSGQQHGSQVAVADMDRQPGWYEFCFAGRNGQWLTDTGAHVQAG